MLLQIVVELSIPNCCESCNRNLADAVTFMEGVYPQNLMYLCT